MVSKYSEQKMTEIQEETDKSTIIVGDSNASKSVLGRCRKRVQWKNTDDVNNTIKVDLCLPYDLYIQQGKITYCYKHKWSSYKNWPSTNPWNNPHHIKGSKWFGSWFPTLKQLTGEWYLKKKKKRERWTDTFLRKNDSGIIIKPE